MFDSKKVNDILLKQLQMIGKIIRLLTIEIFKESKNEFLKEKVLLKYTIPNVDKNDSQKPIEKIL